jgi:hypothetical protein
MKANSPDTVRRPGVVVVSYLANAPFAPRGIRTRELVRALERERSVELIAGPIENSSRTGAPAAGRTLVRKALQLVHSSVLLDKFEFWSRRRFRSWQPDAAGALLIGFPFSPLVYAALRLEASGIPYVVDVGDPWALTVPDGLAVNGNFGLRRARAAERRLWSSAAGAVVTTAGQASALRELFPRLPVLVRPNGFVSVMPLQVPREVGTPSDVDDSVLRLAHFGDIYVARLELERFLMALAQEGEWDRIEFHQYGSDWTGKLKAQDAVTVIFHEPRPWSEIVQAAVQFDLAVVVGNRDPRTLPSKAIEYLQLPIPRLAVVNDDRNDALAQYVADKPGWVVLRVDAARSAGAIRSHLGRQWSREDLLPPSEERWDQVGAEVTRFFLQIIEAGGKSSDPGGRHPN